MERPGLGREIIEAAPDAILVASPDGVIVLVNRELERMLRYDRAELVGRSVEDLVPQARQAAHVEHRARYLKSPSRRRMGQGIEEPIQAVRADGKLIPVEIALSTVGRKDERLLVAIVRDITQRPLTDVPPPEPEAEEEAAAPLGLPGAAADAPEPAPPAEGIAPIDELTGLYSRAFFEAEIDRLSLGRGPISILVADLDSLREINEAEGPEAGNRMLVRMAQVFRTCFRAEDIIGRLGGDEFGVLLPTVDPARMVEVVRRLDAERRHHNDEHGGRKLEFSVGGATAGAGTGLRKALLAADARMFQHKRSKGLRVEPAGLKALGSGEHPSTVVSPSDAERKAE
ncbi:MAG: diguanylate cyclase domain-containing protein [Sandaracinaceae bacterium]